ncbi:hypothetical protein BRI6_1289 [plant metagenome]|uniref:Uncharacterized protein n=1 Tax=plant metagenome TaxID=1297885 RepID=A0A484T3A1_9ZZZZ
MPNPNAQQPNKPDNKPQQNDQDPQRKQGGNTPPPAGQPGNKGQQDQRRP